jgi:GntR family transcriptional regulator, transcriptional repressor for pyruvate dehydrogenase complex
MTEKSPTTRKRERLAQAVVETLRRRIAKGILLPGDQIPTEPQLEEEFSVSRTVIREAIAELRAAGLVTPMQGKGVFVAHSTSNGMDRLTAREISSVPEMLELLEFRQAIEMEAAAIAAYRRSPLQEGAIRAAYDEMARAIEENQPTVQADYAFHRAIAEATNNRFFIEATERFGPRAIPRSQFPTLPEASDRAYLEGVLKEHADILEAISDQDPEGARQAMRTHLMGSQRRYRRLAR